MPAKFVERAPGAEEMARHREATQPDMDMMKATVVRLVTRESEMAMQTCQRGLDYFKRLAQEG